MEPPLREIIDEPGVVEQVERILHEAVESADTFPIHPLLHLDGITSDKKPNRIVEALWNHGTTSVDPQRAWGHVYKWRVQLTFQLRQDLVWLEDKVTQRRLMQYWPRDAAEPLPSHWFNADQQAEAEAELARLLAREGTCIVVKPRHAASGQGMSILRAPCDAATIAAAVRDAIAVKCKGGETWQLYQVPRGVGLEPLYPSFQHCPREPDRPLELKVQTVWGRVIGATLHTSKEVWVMPSGKLHWWATVAPNHAHKRSLQQKYGRFPVRGAARASFSEMLEALLDAHWEIICRESEKIARLWGLDEVRVDWFVGCQQHGPRICEVTWMGTGERIPASLQHVVAQAFVAGHRRRVELQQQGEPLPQTQEAVCAGIARPVLVSGPLDEFVVSIADKRTFF